MIQRKVDTPIAVAIESNGSSFQNPISFSQDEVQVVFVAFTYDNRNIIIL
jgi:hypothetical protein